MKITIEADSINELMSVIKRIANTPPQDMRDEWKIADCGLTDRTVSILRDEGILTLGQLKVFNDHDLLKIPNFGRKCLEEVRAQLAKIADSGG